MLIAKVVLLFVTITMCCHQSLQRRLHSSRPNIVLFITDDQDVELGSMNYMRKTLKIFRDEGAELVNGYVTTPICCPSRTSMLTGLYVHNHHRILDTEQASSYFGKYLNEYNGSYIPPGWKEWMALVRNSRFYNYTVNYNGRKIKHGDNYFEDYFTDLIVNDSINFFKRSTLLFPQKPILLVLSFPAPHGPEDPAPKYNDLFANNTAHRTASWNYAPNPDKQWLLRHTGKMEPVHVAFTDFLQRRRLQTLLSVDDAVHKLYREFRQFGLLDNTYFLYTSDHGYHLGQYGLIKGKTLPYDCDIKVPFFVRGPKIAKGLRVTKPVANIDIAPTILDMAGLPAPSRFDGRSILPLLIYETRLKQGKPAAELRWRHSVLIERGLRPKLVRLRERLRKQRERYSKDIRIQLECEKEEYQSPCKDNQLWECRKDEVDRYRIFKCRNTKSVWKVDCTCELNDTILEENVLTSKTKKLRKRFTETSISDSLNSLIEGPIFISEQTLTQWEKQFFHQILRKEIENTGWYQGLFDALEDDFIGDSTYSSEKYDNQIDENEFRRSTRSIENTRIRHKDFRLAQGCVLFPNDTLRCMPEIYRGAILNRKQQKHVVNDKIRMLRNRLRNLKYIRRQLKGNGTAVQSLLFGESEDEEDGNFSEQNSNGDDQQQGLLLGDVVDNNSSQEHCPCVLNSGKSHPLKKKPFDEISDADLIRWATRMGRGRSERRRGRKSKDEDGKRRRVKPKHLFCNVPNLNCFSHDNSHWRTEPFWTLGPFCFCQNSYNNSYGCLRTVNVSHNFLYCEFVTGFVSYYDMYNDPFQLHNIVYELSVPMLEQLSAQLDKLRRCHDCVASLLLSDGFAVGNLSVVLFCLVRTSEAFGVVRNLVCAYTSMSPDSSFGIVRFSGIVQREGNSRNNPDMGQVLSTFSSIKLVLRKVVMLNGVFALSRFGGEICEAQHVK
ncbi:Extracellular sulfatase Sulf-1 [Trichinella pseudospiralis]|uniref:Extracellular sulfatase Sulf-1 n=1 Tax=Trichinella pseudospiralis TaxID=6337 RepID=A0A0V1FMU4_TRIPS|nr:Extracellular sulfatase Sulf-1 [Trichinella pseudospiralis]